MITKLVALFFAEIYQPFLNKVEAAEFVGTGTILLEDATFVFATVVNVPTVAVDEPAKEPNCGKYLPPR